MNKELLDSMNKQMSPSPEARAALTEKLTQPVKKRPVPWIKYGAIAACAALVIGVFPFYQAMKGLDNINGQEILWTHRAGMPLHSYVTVEGLTGTVTENAAVSDKGGGGRENYSTGVIDRDTYAGDILDRPQAPHTGDLPGGAYVGDVPVQEGAEDYQKLMDHFNGALPDWYGGAYLNDAGWLVVQLVESEDPGDKSLELQVLDWTDDGHVTFFSCKYSLAQLKELMDRLNALPDSDPVCRDVMAGWGVNEEANRIELTLTDVNDHILSVLAELDPDDDAIYVQVGQRAVADVGSREPAVIGEDPAVHHVMPGGVTVPEDGDLSAEEPVYDGAHYDLEDLPGKLPEEMRPAATVDSVSERDVSTSSYNPDAK